MTSSPQGGAARKTALVIGAGSAMCAASLGLWKTLQEADIPLHLTVGCSGGSIYAALIALGCNPAQVEAWTMDLWSPELFEGYAAGLRAALSGETRFTERSGMVDDGVLQERLRAVFGDTTFSETLLPLYIVSTDLFSGESVVHSEGSLFDAIRASLAIPMIFSPWQIGDRLLVDGAVSDPLPVDVAIREGGEIILAMGFHLPTRTRMRSYSAVTSHLNSLYMNNLLKAQFAFYNLAHHAEIIPILPDFGRQIGAFDTDNMAEIISSGAKATEEFIPYLRQLLLPAD